MKYFNFKFLLLFFALAVALPPAWAQGTLTVYEGDVTNSNVPFKAHGYYMQQNQMIYQAADLAAMNGKMITGITFHATGNTYADIVGAKFDVYLGNTTQSEFATATMITDLTKVASDKVFQVFEDYTLVIEFDEPFAYTGDNLVIEINLHTPFTDEGFYTNHFQGVTVSKASLSRYASGSYWYTPSVVNFLPHTTFAYEEPQPYMATVSPKSINFGKTAPGASITKEVTVKNNGTEAFTPAISGLASPYSTTYTPSLLASGESATIPVVFNPTSEGEFAATLVIADNGGNITPISVNLTGSAKNEVTVAEGSSTNTYLPIHGYYFDETNQNQMVYPANMLTAIKGKTIKSMTFYPSDGINFYLKNNSGVVTFSLGNLEENTPEYGSSPTRLEGYGEPNAVITMDSSKHPEYREWTIEFSTPFVYNGGDLLIDVESTAGGYGESNFYGIETQTYQSYNSHGGGSKVRRQFLPKVTFSVEDSGETPPVVNVDAPVFNPENGTTFEENLTVTLTCATAGATIQYSYNGEYFTDYEAPIVIDETTTIYAKAVLGTNESEVVNATYTKEAAPQPSTNEYVLVKDVADLAAGKHIIFVNKENAKAMSSTQKTNNRAATDITINSDIATATEATEIFTLEQDGDYWLFKATKEPGYIYAAGANSNNYLKTEETADDKAKANVTIDSDGKATVAFNAGTRNILMYNSGSSIFSCYASGQLPVYIFIEKSGDTPEPTQVATPTFNPAQGEYTEAQNVAISCATTGATIHYTTDGTEPTAESAIYAEPIAVGETMTIKAIAIKAGMTNSEIATATYTINIPSGEGTTFVKVTAADQLVAGKRYIIVSGNKAVGSAASGNFLSAVSITGGDEVIVGDDVAIMTLGGNAGHYTLALGDKYLYGTTKSGNLSFGNTTEWAISNFNGTLDGYRVKHADADRAVKYSAGYNRFGNYATSDANSEYGWIYVEKTSTTEPVDPEMSFGETTAFTVYPNDEFTAPTLTTVPADLPVSYSSTDEAVAVVDPANGDVVIGEKIGTTTITASFSGNEQYNAATATYTITVEARPYLMAEPMTLTMTTTAGTSVEKKFTVMGEHLKGNVTLTLNDENEVYSINPASITVGAKADDEASKEITVTYNPTAVGTHNATITIASQDAEGVTVTLNGTSTKPALGLALTPAEGTFTVGKDAKVYVTVQNGDDETMVTYKINGGAELNYTDDGISLPNTKAGPMTVEVYATDGEREATVEAEYTFEAAEAIVVNLNPAGGQYYVGNEVTVTVTAENTIGEYLVTYKINDGEELDYDGNGIVITNDQMGTVNLEVTVTDGYDHKDGGTATGTYNFIVRPVVVAPTFKPEPGSYTAAQPVTIECEDEDATILYSIDGGTTWNEGTSYTADKDVTIMAKATKDGSSDSEIVTAFYDIDIPTPLPTMEVIDGYFSAKNVGNDMYANIAGRKTLNFVSNNAKAAGTVIRLVTNDKGQVQVLRSQAADLQGYANRAMNYVPEIVDMIVTKLHAEGDGALLGDEGLDAIMAKFNECFDYHLYVEKDDNGYRIYGKTPSMQPVVDFYREHKQQVETKLPMLEDFINDAIQKVLQKTNGSGASILKPFSIHDTWERMGGTLTEPVDDESTMEFYRQVLNYKDNVWNFAYETAMTYWERLKNHPRYDEEIKPQLGEFAEYIEEIENVHPDFKYYIVQENNKPDFISQGNAAIMNGETRTYWTLEERKNFTVNFPEANLLAGRYLTTLYTDFAYTLPEDVFAYKVIAVDDLGYAVIKPIEGTVPAQTPVILKSINPGDQLLTLSTSTAAAPTDNILVGADYFIEKHNIVTPQVEKLFTLAKSIFGQTFYANYVEQYEHLMLKTAGTVNNKYFWGLTNDDLEKCIGKDSNGVNDCEVRNLSVGDKGVGFYSNMTAPANEAFLDNLTFNPVKLTVRGDVDRDGDIDVADLAVLIDILLGLETDDVTYDFIAADFDEDGYREISDVSSMIDYLLEYKFPSNYGHEGDDE